MKADPMAELRSRFLVRTVDDKAALINALVTGDEKQVERLAHGLAGSASIFGFYDVGTLAIAVDEGFASGRGLDTKAVHDLIAALEALS